MLFNCNTKFKQEDEDDDEGDEDDDEGDKKKKSKEAKQPVTDLLTRSTRGALLQNKTRVCNSLRVRIFLLSIRS